MVGEVASSFSSTTLAKTVAAEDEHLESSIEGVRRQLAFCGGLESNLKPSVKPSSRRSSSEHSSRLHDKHQLIPLVGCPTQLAIEEKKKLNQVDIIEGKTKNWCRYMQGKAYARLATVLEWGLSKDSFFAPPFPKTPSTISTGRFDLSAR
ncbi:hypothetical protein TRIUR3_28896 [Triticum urartu]|uniref:Uncharacterized protein n=1 Tax=Triticum urartu TaxID=4572 RepID=M8A381_TRIUA|nr:hypothetical protein TRIUR3_28896 [Triticum urartu]